MRGRAEGPEGGVGSEDDAEAFVVLGLLLDGRLAMARPLGWYSGTTLASRQGTAVATASLSLMAWGSMTLYEVDSERFAAVVRVHTHGTFY